MVFGLGGAEILILLFIVIPFLIIPVIALIDILRHEFNGNDKLIWVLVVLLLPVLGSILYFIIGREKRL
jgi:hypothetical protein